MVDHTIFRNSEQFKGLDTKSSDVSRDMQYSSDMRNAMYKLSGAICKRKGFTLQEGFTEEIKGMYTFKSVSNRTGTLTDDMLTVVGDKIKSYKEHNLQISAYLDKDIISNNKYGLPESIYDNLELKLEYDSDTNMFYVYQDGLRIYQLYVTENMTIEELNDRLAWGVQTIYNQAIADNIQFFANTTAYVGGTSGTVDVLTDIDFNNIQLAENNKILNEALSLIRSRGPNYLTQVSTDLQNIPPTMILNPLMRLSIASGKEEGNPTMLDDQKTWYRMVAGSASFEHYFYIPSEDIVVYRDSNTAQGDTSTQNRVELYDGSYAFYDKDPYDVSSEYDKAIRDNMFDSVGYNFPISGYTADNGHSPYIKDFFEHLVNWVAPYQAPPLPNTSTRNNSPDTIYPDNSHTNLNFKRLGITKESSSTALSDFTIDDLDPSSYFYTRLKQRYPNWLTATSANMDPEYFVSDLDWSGNSVSNTNPVEYIFAKQEINYPSAGDNVETRNKIRSSLISVTGDSNLDLPDGNFYLDSNYYRFHSVGTFSLKAAIHRDTDLGSQASSNLDTGRFINYGVSSATYMPGQWFKTSHTSSDRFQVASDVLSKSPIKIEVIDGTQSLLVREYLTTSSWTLTNQHYDIGNRLSMADVDHKVNYLEAVDRNIVSFSALKWINEYQDNVLYNASTENCSFASLNEVLYISNGLDNIKKYDGRYVYRAGVPNAADEGGGNSQYDINNRYMYLFEYTDYQGNTISGEPRYVPATEIASHQFPGADNSIFEGFDTRSTYNLEWQSYNNQIIPDTPSFEFLQEQYRIEKIANERRMRIKIYDNNGDPNRLHFLAYDIGVLDTDFTLADLGGVSYADPSIDDTNLAYQPDVKRHDPPPKGKYLTTFKNCLVISGQLENSNNVQYSLPFSTSTLEIGSEYFPSDDNAVIVESKEGDKITAAYAFRDMLYIFHDSSISGLSGDIGLLETPYVRSISQEAGIGCVANSTIQELNGQVVFLSSKGFYSIFNTVQIRKFSDVIENLFINTSSINRQLNRSVSFIWETKQLFISVIPQLAYDASSGRYLLDKDKTLLLAYDYAKDAWFRWDNLEFTGGAAAFRGEIYFSKIEDANTYKMCKISNNNIDTDYSDEGSAINFYYETNWESLQMPSVPKKFLRLKMYFMDVDKDFENDGFSLKIGVCKDYVKGEASSININLDNAFNKGWGEFFWGSDTWGGNWGGGTNNIFIKHKLPNFKAKSLKLVFSNNDNNQNILINNWEYEIASTYRQEIKD